MSMFWKSQELHKQSLVVGLIAICTSFLIPIVFLLFHAIVQHLIPCLLICEALNSILSIIKTTLLGINVLCLITGVFCLLLYIYFERDNTVHNSDFYRYWSPKFSDFLNNRFDNKLLLNFVTDHINFLESEQSRLNQLVQSVVISILLNIILTKLTLQLELFSIELLYIVIVIVAIILFFLILRHTLFLINGISYSKLSHAREVKTLLQLEILRTESQSDSKTAID